MKKINLNGCRSWKNSLVGLLVWILLVFSIAFADDVYITVDVTPSPVPPNTIRATMLAIAQINPLATLLMFLMPVIIGEGIINAFEGVKVNEPLKAAIRLMIIIISLALFAAVF